MLAIRWFAMYTVNDGLKKWSDMQLVVWCRFRWIFDNTRFNNLLNKKQVNFYYNWPSFAVWTVYCEDAVGKEYQLLLLFHNDWDEKPAMCLVPYFWTQRRVTSLRFAYIPHWSTLNYAIVKTHFLGTYFY